MDIEDIEAPDAICEMCETQEIRYVHYMKHPNYPQELKVGCVCAGNMEQDYKRARQRESDLKNVLQRRRRWLSRNWHISDKGNHYLNTDDFNITVFRKPSDLWGARIQDCASGRTVWSRRRYTSEDQVKLAAFDTMFLLKSKRTQDQMPQ